MTDRELLQLKKQLRLTQQEITRMAIFGIEVGNEEIDAAIELAKNLRRHINHFQKG